MTVQDSSPSTSCLLTKPNHCSRSCIQISLQCADAGLQSVDNIKNDPHVRLTVLVFEPVSFNDASLWHVYVWNDRAITNVGGTWK